MTEIYVWVDFVAAIPLSYLFSDRESTYLYKLKSQQDWLELTDSSQGSQLFGFLWAMAAVQKFQLNVVEKVNKAFKKTADDVLLTPQGSSDTWALFDQLSQGFLTSEMTLAPCDLTSAAYCFNAGYARITSHLDKSQESPQSFTPRETLMPELAKQLGIQAPVAMSYDANVMIRDPFDQGLPQGVTMSKEEQVALGIVCSSTHEMLTSVGNAGGAALENFFMLRWGYCGSERTYTIFSVMSEGLFDQIAALAGVSGPLDEAQLLGWVGSADGVKAFLSVLYILIQASINQRLRVEQADVAQRLEDVYADHSTRYAKALSASGKKTLSWLAVPSSIAPLVEKFRQPLSPPNKVNGRGIKIIKLRSADGLDIDAVPLLNTGLMRDIQRLAFSRHENEFRREWRGLFNDVSLGGAKPQNAGTFFTAFIHKGQAKVLDCPISGQNGGLRWIKRQVREGKQLYLINRVTALEICPRKPQQGTEWLNRTLHATGKRALAKRLTLWVDQVLGYYESLHDLAVTERQLSITQLMAPSDRASVCAERRIVLGQASLSDYKTLSHSLGKQLSRYAVLTLEEKRFIRRILPQIISKRAQE